MNYDELLDQAKRAAEPALKQEVANLRARFIGGIKDIGENIHHAQIGALFDEAAATKLQALMATDPAEAALLEHVYSLNVLAIQSYVLGAQIVADAKTASLVREMAKQALDTLGSVASTVLRVVVSSVVAGVINGATGGAGGTIIGAATSALGGLLQPDQPPAPDKP